MSLGERVLLAVATLLLPTEDREVILGDVLELRAERAERVGRLGAFALALADIVASAWSRRTGRGPQWRRPPSTRPRWSPVADVLSDVRVAVRSLLREPGFTAVTVATLALGLGAVASVFGMANQFILRPLPGAGGIEDVAYLRLLSRGSPNAWNGQGLAALDFDALRRDADFASAVASYGYSPMQVAHADERPRRVNAELIYGDYFEALGARPSEGRLLTADDASFGADPLVAVLSEGLRAELFGENQAVGATLRVNGVAVRILGVAAGGLQGAERNRGAEMWLPHPSLVPLLSFPEDGILSRNSVMHDDIVVRMNAGWSVERATERVQALLDGISSAVPEQAEYLGGLEPVFFPGLHTPPGARESLARSLGALAVVVGIVLLLACANAANLLLFRNVTRRGQAAVRRALGASAGRIVRMELLQSLVLGCLGSAAGLGVAWLLSLALRGERLVGLPAMEPLTFDGRLLAFATAGAVITTLLFGALPAVLAGRFDLRGALQASGRGGTDRVAHLRSAMASGQVALSLALLVAGVMLVRTVANLYAVDPGVRVDGIAVQWIDFARGLSEEDRQEVRQRALRAVESVPGVEGAAISEYDPLGGARMIGRIAADDGDEIPSEMVPVSARWFEVMDVADAGGRPILIDEEEWRDDTVVLSAGLATRLFGSPEAAMGRVVRHRFGRTPVESRVIAVTGELRVPNEPDAPREAFMVPHHVSPSPQTTLLVRLGVLSGPTLESVRAAVEGVIPDAPIASPEPLTRRLDSMHAEERVFGTLLALLSGASLLLAAVGLYGVVAFSVASRRRELGIRIAVGAGARRIVSLVAAYVGSIVGVGIALGIAGGYGLSRMIESRLYGVAPDEPWSYVVAAAVFVVISGMACWAPTRRAVAVDPVAALRAE